MTKTPSRTSGFTLVELMVVVAIIGLLSSIAIPAYKRYQAQSRASEAKVDLTGLYSGETSFAAEYQTFTSCLNAIGFQRNGQNTFYTIGFDDATAVANTCGPGSPTICNAYSWSGTQVATASCTVGNGNTLLLASGVAGAASLPTSTQLNTAPLQTALAKSSFLGGAAGNISSTTSSYDLWTIDQANNILNVQTAY